MLFLPVQRQPEVGSVTVETHRPRASLGRARCTDCPLSVACELGRGGRGGHRGLREQGEETRISAAFSVRFAPSITVR